MEQVTSVLFPKARTFASSTKQTPVAGRSGGLQTSIRSALYIRKRMRERELPSGTPYSDEKGEEVKPGKHRLVDTSKRKDEVKLTSHWGIRLFLGL
jgi:hypothetical protein